MGRLVPVVRIESVELILAGQVRKLHCPTGGPRKALTHLTRTGAVVYAHNQIQQSHDHLPRYHRLLTAFCNISHALSLIVRACNIVSPHIQRCILDKHHAPKSFVLYFLPHSLPVGLGDTIACARCHLATVSWANWARAFFSQETTTSLV